ncbi:hypothetical protein C8T65DRAFT_664126 [Cerioporus squamosus]|nr:hypothetical protein C8T65DRAFT_664126 [Cerioporus squamosus]
MSAAAGPHELPRGPDDSPPTCGVTGKTEQVNYPTQPEWDPVDELLDYILATSDARDCVHVRRLQRR